MLSLRTAARFRTQVRTVVTHNFSNAKSESPGRSHLLDDSRRGYDHNEKFGQPFDAFHSPRDSRTGVDPHYQQQTILTERGRKWVVGSNLADPATLEKNFGVGQTALPFTPRRKPFVWGNYSLVMKAEFLFFYVPGLLILGLILPVFTMTFAFDEAVYTTMTVKVLGRQWYWIYDVESPADNDE